MSCPFKALYSNNSTNKSNIEDTIEGWGCQVIKDGGLNFYIKTDKFLECEYHDDDDDEITVCPFRFHSQKSNTTPTITDSTPIKKPTEKEFCEFKKDIEKNKEKKEQKRKELEETRKKMNELDEQGHFTIPLLNMPPFLTFKETKEILSTMELKLKDINTTWDNLSFYTKNNDNNFNLINDNNQLNQIIKNDLKIIYLK